MNKYLVWAVVILAVWFVWKKSGMAMPAFLSSK